MEEDKTLILWTHVFVMRSHSMTQLTFYLFGENLIFFFFFIEKDLESPLIFVLFLKGKQNKKETPKCNSLFGKDSMWKTKVGFGG